MRGRAREHLMKEKESESEKKERKKTDKDSLHPPVPLSYWPRAHPVPAATDDITV